MSTIYAFLISTIAGLSTLLGGVVIFFKIKANAINKFITFCLSFSIAIMIGISITDLIPTSFFNIMLSNSFGKGITMILLAFLAGIISIFIIDKLTINEKSLYKLGILSMIALILHNFPEGIATFMGSVQNPKLGIKLGIAIMLHNIPEGISIAVPIYYATNSKQKALITTLISGLAEPAGAILAYLFLKPFITEIMISIVLLFVAGIMITLAIEEMLPKAISYKQYKYIYIGLISGLIIIMINHFI